MSAVWDSFRFIDHDQTYQRGLIQGYYHESRDVEWLAEQGGRTVEAVYKAIQRIRRDLQTCIERQVRKELT